MSQERRYTRDEMIAAYVQGAQDWATVQRFDTCRADAREMAERRLAAIAPSRPQDARGKSDLPESVPVPQNESGSPYHPEHERVLRLAKVVGSLLMRMVQHEAALFPVDAKLTYYEETIRQLQQVFPELTPEEEE